jgi:hypothetical protein
VPTSSRAARRASRGADLANLVNEAALFAARRNGRVVEMVDFEKAKDKIMMGPERKSMVMPEEERRNTAYHEAGHALVGKLLPKTDPVHKVTIIPRGRALGVTMQPARRRPLQHDKERMLSTISVLFGGRIAEEVFMHQMTTGASNDFERATHIARDMVTRYGMTDELGPMVYAENEGEVFLGRSVTKTTNMSERRCARWTRDPPHHRRAVRAGAQADRRATRTRCTPWPRPCWSGKPSTASRSTTSWPASRRVRPRTGHRPGAPSVPLEEELARVVPLVREAVKFGVPISVDTYKPSRHASRAGFGRRHHQRHPGAAPAGRRGGRGGHPSLRRLPDAHAPGAALTMQVLPMQGDVVPQVRAFLSQAAARAAVGGGGATASCWIRASALARRWRRTSACWHGKPSCWPRGFRCWWAGRASRRWAR